MVTILLIVLGFVLLIKGADVLVEGSSSIAKRLKISEMVIGLTIVSVGTSMPELVVNITSSLGGHSDIAIGNIIGSNITNLLLILGLAATIKPIKVEKETQKVEIPICIISTFIFLIVCNINNTIMRYEGLILICLFVAFIIYTIHTAKKNPIEFDEEKLKNTSIIKELLFIVLGIAMLRIGGEFTVDNALLIANKLNWSEKIIGVTIIAIGTCLPELVTTVTASLKGKSNIAVGNIVGSNIFNLLLIIGTSAIISPIRYNTIYNFDMLVLILASVMLLFFVELKPKDIVTRKNGIAYLILYAIYIATVFIK